MRVRAGLAHAALALAFVLLAGLNLERLVRALPQRVAAAAHARALARAPQRRARAPLSAAAAPPHLRLVAYDARGAGLGRQVAALVNALVAARRARAALVLPAAPARAFDEALLAAAAPGVDAAQFASGAAARALRRRRRPVQVPAGTAPYYRALFAAAGGSAVPLAEATGAPRKPRRCAFDVARDALAQEEAPRVALLGNMFHPPMANCSAGDPRWLTLRRYLRPRRELLRAVEAALRGLPCPVLAVHVRVFPDGDVGQFTPDAFVDMLWRQFAQQVGAAKSVFVAFSPGSEESAQVVRRVRDRFRGRVLSGDELGEYLVGDGTQLRDMEYGAAVMDAWMCVKSDFFIGRVGSSLSWNIVYWRQALASEYELRHTQAHWYGLSNFSTTGATRDEWDLHNTP